MCSSWRGASERETVLRTPRKATPAKSLETAHTSRHRRARPRDSEQSFVTAHRARAQRETASNAQANETRVTGGKTEHKQNTPTATSMPSNIPAAPKSQYEIERDERIKRNEAFMLSIGIDPHGGGYVLSSA